MCGCLRFPDLLVGSEDGLIRLYEASAWPSPTASPGHTGVPGEPFTFRFELPALMWHNADRPNASRGNTGVYPKAKPCAAVSRTQTSESTPASTRVRIVGSFYQASGG